MSSRLEEVEKVFKNDQEPYIYMGVCGWDRCMAGCAAGMGVWPHTPCVGVFGSFARCYTHKYSSQDPYLDYSRLRTLK